MPTHKYHGSCSACGPRALHQCVPPSLSGRARWRSVQSNRPLLGKSEENAREAKGFYAERQSVQARADLRQRS
jgi:hypothetical protein